MLALRDAFVADIAPQSTTSASGISEGSGATVQVDRSVFSNTGSIGIDVQSATSLSVNDAEIYNVQGLSGIQTYNSQLDVARVYVHGISGIGMNVANGHARILDSVIEAVRTSGTRPETGTGILTIGASAQISGVRIARVDAVGIGALSPPRGSTVDISSSVISDTTNPVSGSQTGGILAAITNGNDVDVNISNVLIERANWFGVNAKVGSHVHIGDSVFRQILGHGSDLGVAVNVDPGSAATVERVLVSDSTGVGFGVSGANATLDISDSSVRNITPQNMTNFSLSGGLVVDDGARATFRHSRVENVGICGVMVSQSDGTTGTNLEFEDSIVTGIAPMMQSTGGSIFAVGLAIEGGASGGLTRSVIEQMAPLGVYVRAGSLAIRDSAIRQITSLGDGRCATAIFSVSGAAVSAARVLLDQCQDSALYSSYMGQITLSDSIVQHISSSQYGYGQAITAVGSGTVQVSRVAAIDTAGAAVMATPTSAVTGAAGGATPSSMETGAAVTGHDLYVEGVGSSNIRVSIAADGTPHADGPPVSYALHAGAGANINIDHGVLVRAGFGVYDAWGTMTLSSSVISGMLDSAGASSGPLPTFTDVSMFGNVSDQIVARGDLPSAATVPPPEPACTNQGCL
jgi:hypothetical protein